MSSSIDNGQSSTVENTTVPTIAIRSASQPQNKIQTTKIKTADNSEIIGFSRPYLFSVSGILRILLIVYKLKFLLWNKIDIDKYKKQIFFNFSRNICKKTITFWGIK